jgi:hypothetical protein
MDIGEAVVGFCSSLRNPWTGVPERVIPLKDKVSCRFSVEEEPVMGCDWFLFPSKRRRLTGLAGELFQTPTR